MTSSGTAPEALTLGAELDLRFTDLLANGQAVARASGMVVFCFGPLPGEFARVRITALKPRYSVAELQRLLEVSPQRSEPFCPVFGTCGGCQVQHLAYDGQLEWKKSMVESALTRIGGISDARVLPTVASGQPRNYRNKMALVVERADRASVVGFYRARSHDVVPIDACPIVDPLLSEYISRFAAARPGEPLGVAIERATHLIARQSRNGQAVLSVTTPEPFPPLAGVAEEVRKALPGAAGIANSYEPPSANAVMGRHERRLAGTMEIEETIGGIVYRVSPGSFFQVNTSVVERIFVALGPEIAGLRAIVDLYCGMGTFSLLFARSGACVTGVEENRRAVDEAKANAKRNALDSKTEFVAQRVEQWVASPQGRTSLGRAESIFLDPPRKGSDETTLRAIIAARTPRVFYLSCDPATLARDLRLLVANGYGLRSVQPFDMFPQTGHVETLAVLAHA